MVQLSMVFDSGTATKMVTDEDASLLKDKLHSGMQSGKTVRVAEKLEAGRVRSSDLLIDCRKLLFISVIEVGEIDVQKPTIVKA